MRNRCEHSQDIIVDYHNGLSLKELSVKYNLTIEGIRYHLRHFDDYKPQRAKNSIKIFNERIKDMDTKNKTNIELYESFKDIYPNFQTFRQILTNSGVPYKRLRSKK